MRLLTANVELRAEETVVDDALFTALAFKD